MMCSPDVDATTTTVAAASASAAATTTTTKDAKETDSSSATTTVVDHRNDGDGDEEVNEEEILSSARASHEDEHHHRQAPTICAGEQQQQDTKKQNNDDDGVDDGGGGPAPTSSSSSSSAAKKKIKKVKQERHEPSAAMSHHHNRTTNANTSSTTLTSRTIQTMASSSQPNSSQPSGLLADPIHCHSFAPIAPWEVWIRCSVPFGVGNKCAGCGQRLVLLAGSRGRNHHTKVSATTDDIEPELRLELERAQGGGGGSATKLVRCAACGAFAHRRCAFDRSRRTQQQQRQQEGEGGDKKGGGWTMEPCPVNGPLMMRSSQPPLPSSSSSSDTTASSIEEGEGGIGNRGAASSPSAGSSATTSSSSDDANRCGDAARSAETTTKSAASPSSSSQMPPPAPPPSVPNVDALHLPPPPLWMALSEGLGGSPASSRDEEDDVGGVGGGGGGRSSSPSSASSSPVGSLIMGALAGIGVGSSSRDVNVVEPPAKEDDEGRTDGAATTAGKRNEDDDGKADESHKKKEGGDGDQADNKDGENNLRPSLASSSSSRVGSFLGALRIHPGGREVNETTTAAAAEVDETSRADDDAVDGGNNDEEDDGEKSSSSSPLGERQRSQSIVTRSPLLSSKASLVVAALFWHGGGSGSASAGSSSPSPSLEDEKVVGREDGERRRRSPSPPQLSCSAPTAASSATVGNSSPTPVSPPMAAFGRISTPLPLPSSSAAAEERSSAIGGDEDDEDDDPVWTPDGPPSHWALSKPGSLRGIVSVGRRCRLNTTGADDEEVVGQEEEAELRVDDDNGDEVTAASDASGSGGVDDDASPTSLDAGGSGSGVNYWDQPFASVSKALQENLLAYLLRTGGVDAVATAAAASTSAGRDGEGAEEEEENGRQFHKDAAKGDKDRSCEKEKEEEVGDGHHQDGKSSGRGIIDDRDNLEKAGPAVVAAKAVDDVEGEAPTPVPPSCDEIGMDTSDRGSGECVGSPSPSGSESSPDRQPVDFDVKDLLKEVKPKPPPRDSSRGQQQRAPGVATVASSAAVEVMKKSSKARASLGIASVAGAMAGGVAGLAIAGPAGAAIGAKFGQTAGVLGVILEGGVSIGVIVAGVAAASLTVKQMQGDEKRMLTIGEDGTKRKVVLVRPNIVVDPVWEGLTDEARRTWTVIHKPGVFGSIIAGPKKKAADIAKKERYLRDADIVETDENEITTEDKVVLLVSRSLNDKTSLPGHVYRCLIKEHRDRCENRKGIGGSSRETEQCKAHPTTDETSLSRERRQDTHGVIKHVTATLLEVRPGFGASPAITEMSATAVESLVFGELYDSVFEEILIETEEKDRELMRKIQGFLEALLLGRDLQKESETHIEGEKRMHAFQDCISSDALIALKMLPEAHSVVDKLSYCVRFLEHISVKFSSPQKDDRETMDVMGADSLLKMVCQHIVAAKIENLNAELVFLEEFARDEQLLRGKEGYALVTLQASLHFLNASNDFDRDIFQHE